MEKTVLIVTAVEGAENMARALSREADAVVEIARSRRAALARLRRDPVTALLLDTSLPDAEMTTSDMLWQNAAGAVPLELQSTITVLLLESDVMLREKGISPEFADNVQTVKDLTDSLRLRLRSVNGESTSQLAAS